MGLEREIGKKEMRSGIEWPREDGGRMDGWTVDAQGAKDRGRWSVCVGGKRGEIELRWGNVRLEDEGWSAGCLPCCSLSLSLSLSLSFCEKCRHVHAN